VPESPPKTELRTIFFDMHAPPDEAMTVGDPNPDGPRPEYVAPYFGGRTTTQDLVSHKETDGLRLSIIRLAPGTVLPRHSHDVDYIEFVLEGEAHHGNRVLRAGAGVFRPAGTVYTYTAGPQGAVIADFRAHTYYRTTWSDEPADWPPHKVWG
jgi:quercetin dioxygenase-like cupin family protein